MKEETRDTSSHDLPRPGAPTTSRSLIGWLPFCSLVQRRSKLSTSGTYSSGSSGSADCIMMLLSSVAPVLQQLLVSSACYRHGLAPPRQQSVPAQFQPQRVRLYGKLTYTDYVTHRRIHKIHFHGRHDLRAAPGRLCLQDVPVHFGVHHSSQSCGQVSAQMRKQVWDDPAARGDRTTVIISAPSEYHAPRTCRAGAWGIAPKSVPMSSHPSQQMLSTRSIVWCGFG